MCIIWYDAMYYVQLLIMTVKLHIILYQSLLNTIVQYNSLGVYSIKYRV